MPLLARLGNTPDPMFLEPVAPPPTDLEVPHQFSSASGERNGIPGALSAQPLYATQTLNSLFNTLCCQAVFGISSLCCDRRFSKPRLIFLHFPCRSKDSVTHLEICRPRPLQFLPNCFLPFIAKIFQSIPCSPCHVPPFTLYYFSSNQHSSPHFTGTSQQHKVNHIKLSHSLGWHL